MPYLYSFKANSMHFMSYNLLYDPLSLFQFPSNFINALLLNTNTNIVNMRHTTCFETPLPLIYHICTALKPIVCILCHYLFIRLSQPISISIKLHQHMAFKYSFTINIANKRYTACFDTPQPHYIPPKTDSMHFMPYNFLYDL